MSERYSCIDNKFPWKVHFGIMKRFHYRERMFIARSYKTLVTELYYIGFLAMNGFIGTTAPELQRTLEYNNLHLDDGAVPRLDRLTTKFGKSTLVQYQ